MFYRKKIKYPALSTIAVNFSNFTGGLNTSISESVMPLKYAKKCYNFRSSNGVLSSGMGIKLITMPDADSSTSEANVTLPSGVYPISLVHYRYYHNPESRKAHRLMVYASDGYMYNCLLYTQNLNTFSKLNYMHFNEKPKFINYRLNGVDSLIFTSPSDSLTVWNPNITPQVVATAPSINSMCLHYERLFATVNGEKNAVWFSHDLDPTNWTVSMEAGGFIQMDDDKGCLNSVLSFNDYLYAFRDFGIARITAFTEQENFSVTQVYCSSTKIYAESACVCGDVILFLASDGLYSFNGVSVSKVNLGFENLFYKNNSNAKAAFFKNKYYLSCCLNIEGESNENNSLLEYDLNSGETSILYGYCILDMLTIKDNNLEKLALVVEGENTNYLGELTQDGLVFGSATTKVWESAFTPLGYNNKYKQIKEISLLTKTDLDVVTTSENGSVTLHFNGSVIPSKKRLNLKGKMIKIKLVCACADCSISLPQIVIKLE